MRRWVQVKGFVCCRVKAANATGSRLGLGPANSVPLSCPLAGRRADPKTPRGANS
jgi:hypothetical protein